MRRGLAVLLVVRVTAYFPQVRLHGLFAIGGVALSEEVRLVGRDLHQILAAREHSCCDFREARASGELFRLRLGRARNSAQTADVQTAATFAGGSRYAVGSQNHLLVSRVLRLGVDLHQCAGNRLHGVIPFHFCHSSVCFSWC